MNNRKKTFAFLLVLICSIFSLYANYRIVDYKTRVEVSEDYVLNVREDYVFEYDTPRHGFYRVIPYRNYPGHNVKIKDIRVSGGDYQTEKSDGLLTVRVGDADTTVIGQNSYSISYVFDIGADVYEDFDEFYFNLVGTLWECPIENASFEVVFPKPINKEMVWITSGGADSTDEGNASFKVSSDNLVVSGSVKGLDIYEGVTIRTEMEDGYFVGARNYKTIIIIMTILLVILNIALVVLSYLIFHKYGRDDKLIEQSRFEAPDGFTPLSLDFLLNSSFSSSAYPASFIHWADSGFIDIKENEDEKMRLIRKVDFQTFKQECKNDLDYQFFKDIFASSEIGEEVDLEALDSEHLGSALKKLQNAAEVKYDSQLLHDKKASSMRALTFLFAMISAGGVVLFTSLVASSFRPLSLVAAVFYLILSTILLSTLNSKWSFMKFGSKVFTIFGSIALTLVYFVVLYIIILSLELVDDPINIGISALTAVSMFIIIILFSFTEKRSKFYQTTLEEVLGYKSFLKLVEVDQIEMMIDENPNFYFKHLSFAQVLGLTKTWEKKFAKIDVPQPSWYIVPSYGMYSLARMNNVSTSLNKSLNVPLEKYAAAHAAKSGSSSSGFSGSVGGGAGGGGGGAW